MRNNSKNETNEDFNFARCRRCGFPLDKSRDKTLARASFTFTTVSSTVKDISASGGCPFCMTPQPYTKP